MKNSMQSIQTMSQSDADVVHCHIDTMKWWPKIMPPQLILSINTFLYMFALFFYFCLSNSQLDYFYYPFYVLFLEFLWVEIGKYGLVACIFFTYLLKLFSSSSAGASLLHLFTSLFLHFFQFFQCHRF